MSFDLGKAADGFFQQTGEVAKIGLEMSLSERAALAAGLRAEVAAERSDERRNKYAITAADVANSRATDAATTANERLVKHNETATQVAKNAATAKTMSDSYDKDADRKGLIDRQLLSDEAAMAREKEQIKSREKTAKMTNDLNRELATVQKGSDKAKALATRAVVLAKAEEMAAQDKSAADINAYLDAMEIPPQYRVEEYIKTPGKEKFFGKDIPPEIGLRPKGLVGSAVSAEKGSSGKSEYDAILKEDKAIAGKMGQQSPKTDTQNAGRISSKAQATDPNVNMMSGPTKEQETEAWKEISALATKLGLGPSNWKASAETFKAAGEGAWKMYTDVIASLLAGQKEARESLTRPKQTS